MAIGTTPVALIPYPEPGTGEPANGPAQMKALAEAVEASLGVVYRPERYGAVGDGVADDLPAFEAIKAAILVDPTVPARIEITGTHYLSDSIDFDGENLECYLAEGCHVFNSEASSGGHCLGFIGNGPLGTATSPRRGRLYVHGPGAVTGWLAGDNENAIGIVRYAKVLVDGPHVNAGRKGVTAQLGCLDVQIRNITSDECGHHVVSVEDQDGLDVKGVVDNIRFGTTGKQAVFASGTRMEVSRVSGETTNTVDATQAAVHLTSTTTLAYGRADRVEIDNAGAAKGLIVSTASDFDVDKIVIGASSGTALDVFNCPNGGRVGAIKADNSPSSLTVSGTTPAQRVRRLAGERNGLTSGEATMSRHAINSTTLSLPTGIMRLAYFEAARTETITKVRLLSGGTIPTGVTLMRVGVYEVDDATGTLTLVASTANDTTYPAATNTVYTKNLSAPFVKKAGHRYAVGLLGVFSGGALQVAGNTLVGGLGSEAAQAPRLTAAVGSLSDLPSPTQIITSSHDSAAAPYLVLVP